MISCGRRYKEVSLIGGWRPSCEQKRCGRPLQSQAQVSTGGTGIFPIGWFRLLIAAVTPIPRRGKPCKQVALCLAPAWAYGVLRLYPRQRSEGSVWRPSTRLAVLQPSHR